jgi:DNA-binding PadR family transcriptional regulator
MRMSKGFENGTIVPLASKRLRSVGTMERHAQDEGRARDRKLYPVLDQGVMMSAQNWQAYFEAQDEERQRARVFTAMQEVQDLIAKRNNPQPTSQVGTVIPFTGGK